MLLQSFCQGLDSVLGQVARLLRLGDEAGGKVAEANGRLDLVASLPAGTAGTVSLLAAFLQKGGVVHPQPGIPATTEDDAVAVV